jgi:hypothetical protein
VYVFDDVIGPVLSLPDGPLFPDQSPPAVHDVASVDVQLRVADVPYGTGFGAAVKVLTVGGGVQVFEF